MNELSVHIITQSKDLPIVEGNDLFHSRERFLLIEQTAGTWPYMVVVTDEEGRVLAAQPINQGEDSLILQKNYTFVL